MSGILVTTLGASWQIVPELYAFTNPHDFPLFSRGSLEWQREIQALRDRHHIREIGEIWVVTTEGESTQASLESIKQWVSVIPSPPRLRLWRLKGVASLTCYTDCQKMSELILRVVLRAKEVCRHPDKLYLSLSGGFKTMSADMQMASTIFGCDALLHILGPESMDVLRLLKDSVMTEPLEPAMTDLFTILVPMGRMDTSMIAESPPALATRDYPIEPGGGSCEITEVALRQEILERQRRASFLLAHSRQPEFLQGNFPSLATLPPRVIDWLRLTRLGLDTGIDGKFQSLLQALPKADLHCHLGGIFTPVDMTELSGLQELAGYPDLLRWREDIHDALCRRSAAAGEFPRWADFHARILQWIRQPEGRDLPQINPAQHVRSLAKEKKYLAVCAYLQAFREDLPMLQRLIQGDLSDPAAWIGRGIETYERSGDLQGSSLLQTEAILRSACSVLRQRCREQAIRYCELRCSPAKYTLGGLQEEDVMRILTEELKGDDGTQFRLIIIASRHGKMSEAWRHVELVTRLIGQSLPGHELIVGFDLAGDETKRKPSELRDLFLPIHELCLNITIHAGETEPAKSIWEAVYYLSADRVGHGLTLAEEGAEDLRNRFLNRNIAIELCPSSNYQIVGYDDHRAKVACGRTYPLSGFLEEDLCCTINTDNPGISATDLTNEFFKAAAMSPGGLSLLDILKLIHNAFTSSFLPHREKQALLQQAERCILQQIEKSYHDLHPHFGA